MAKIKVTNPKQIINGGAKKYYFKVKGVGGIKGDKGDKGDTGSQGPQGPQGNAATIMVGSTTTLPTGYDATVTNTGTINNAILNFGIPRGIKGDTGAKGDKGDKGDKGEQGNTGPQGPAGQNATVYVGTTTTGAPGTQASVYNSGTDRNAVLNFTIPQGAKGDTGATGATGPQGPTGQNFAPTIVAELPATGDSSKLYLTPKAHTTQTATGNPITASVTEQAGQIESFQLDGDTYQQTYSGKNLFGSQIVQGYYAFANGSYSSNSNAYVTNKDKISVTAGATYTISANKGVYDGSDYTGAGVVFFNNGTYVSSILRPGNGTFTVPSGANQVVYNFYKGSSDENITPSDIEWVQLESGSSATSFEPFVGGQPSPSPEYPQPIQTVTGEQTVEIQGKNLFDKNKALDNFFYTSTGSKSTYSKAQFYNNRFVPTSNKITMSFSAAHDKQNGSNIEANVRIVQYDASGNFISRTMSRTNGYIFTLDANTKSFILCVDNGPDAWFDDLQVEYGSTATTYAPYSKQTLPINLGSIELCKLGTYQDYIYKDGDDWKVHKAISTITVDGSEGWAYNGDNKFNAANISGMAMPINADALCYCATHIGVLSAQNGAEFAPLVADKPYATDVHKTLQTVRIKDIRFTEAQALKTWLSQNNTTIYYVVATATDTTITDQTLIAQLEAVRNATLQASNTITNTATGTNLAGDMEIGYYGYNPTNRYDKWLWLDLNNNYEKLGS